MNAHTENMTVIRDKTGNAAFVVLPVSEYEALVGKIRNDADYIPEEVVSLMFLKKMSPVRAWREYLGLTQNEVAEKLGMTQGAYSKIEAREKLKSPSRIRVAAALGIFKEQLDL